MRMRFTPQAIVLTLCLAVAATAAFGGEAPAARPAPYASTNSAAPAAPMAPAAPPAPAAPRVPAAPNIDEAALQARMNAARRRMEVAAQQLAVLSAQISGRMMRRYELFTGPPHALIGVQLSRSSGPAGARVREVSPGGPAQRAGLRAGDLIVAVNGTDVRGTEPARRVVELLRGVRPGEKVALRVLRGGKSRDFAVTARADLGEYFGAGPVQLPDLPLPPVAPPSAWGRPPLIIRGPIADMELARLTPALGRYFGTDTGVLVVRAPPGGALGLQDGDVILGIGGRKPIDSAHVIRILASYDPGEKLTLEVLRRHRRMAVATTMPAQPATPRREVTIRGAEVRGPGAVLSLRTGDGTL